MRRAADAGTPREGGAARSPGAAALVLFLLVGAAIAAAGALAYGAGAADLRRQAGHELATIASLKEREITRWRGERIADGDAIAIDLARELEAGADAPRALDHWHEALRSHREYLSLSFVGEDGRTSFAAGEPRAEAADPITQALLRGGDTGRTTLTPLLRDPGNPALHLHVVAPVAAGGRRLGTVILSIDPHRHFFGMVQAWPGASDSGEILVVRSEHGSALLVNALRSGDAPMTLRVPLDRREDPAARAASGERAVFEGRDHRGTPVLAAVAPIPDSSWALVAKEDTREAFAPIRTLGRWIVGMAAALTLTAGLAAVLWWRTHAGALERARIADDTERRLLSRKLESLTRHAREMVILADADLRIVEANDSAAAALGYSRDELVGMPVRDVRDPATVSTLDARLEEVAERGALVFETRYRRKDGSTFPVELSVHVDAYDGHRFFLAIGRDVTPRERAAEALRASEAKFRAAFEFASLGILMVAPDGRVVETNRAFQRMLGYGEDELRSVTLDDLCEPGDAFASAVLTPMIAGAQDLVETPRRYRRKDGSVAETIVRASALRDEAGALRLAIGVVEDLSERRRLEAQLVLADRMASIGTLAAGVAHEINNPLAFILSNLDYATSELREKGGDAELVRALQDATDGAVRVREIVRDLRTFSRSDDDRGSAVDVRRVLQTAIGLAMNEIRHRARLVVNPGALPPVVAPEHRLAQVLLNLLINAAQAIPEGDAVHNAVSVSTSTAADGGALVEISDTGVGIPARVLPRIFDPFFTTKPVGVGTGLGLSICHGIVAQLGGEITVESAPGKGTTFRVHLPAAPAAPQPRHPALADPPSDPATPAAPAGAAPAPAPGRRGRVLLVDDDALVGRAVARMLAPGHEVVTRTSARAALEVLAADRAFDAVLCDLMMPEMSGMELHERLVELAPELARRTIFLTGGAFTPAAAEFLQRVPNLRLEKPVERKVLCETVDRVVDSAPAVVPA